jgi:hypothetical protein
VCGVVVEEASREGEVTGFEPQQPWSVASLRKKCATYWWVAGWSSRFQKSTVLAGTYVTRQHCGSGAAGRHPPAKIAICAGTILLAGVAPVSTNAF